jgi:flap endonuclease-1
MGIRNFNVILKKHAKDSVTEKPIQDYHGKKMAIDCAILLYKYRYSSKQNENCHISGFMNRVKYYLGNGVTPVFVFDGAPPDAKKNTLVKRQNMKKKIQDKIDTLKQIEPNSEDEENKLNNEIDKLESQIVYVKKCHVDDCKTLLELIGIPYVTAPDEAEKYCAYLQKQSIVDYTVTDDTDALTFGCENVIRMGIMGNLVEVNLQSILEAFEMTRSQFVDFCILAGCDYCPYIPKIGGLTAFSLIKKHSSIENIMGLDKYSFPDDFNYSEARELFTTFDYPVPEQFEIKSINKKGLSEFLESKDFKETYISRFLKNFNSE